MPTYIICWTKRGTVRGDDGEAVDHYEVRGTIAEARELYDKVSDEGDTFSASLTAVVESTDYDAHPSLAHDVRTWHDSVTPCATPRLQQIELPEGERKFMPTIDTLCDGTVPGWWTDDRRPVMYATREEAEAEQKDHVAERVAAGMDADDDEEGIVAVIDAGDTVYDAVTQRVYWRKGDGQ
jgi:hypothetical protein